MTLDMAYDATKGGITTKSDAGTLLYGNSSLPYAVSGINPKTTLTPSAAQTITYTSFGSVSTISENNYNATFVYNADNQRAQMVVKQGTSAILTRWYPTASYIKETAGSVTKEYTFIGGDAYTAPVAAVKQGSTTTYYDIMRDYLGNITHVVNASTKAVTAQYSFDTWGRMRNATTWAYYAPGSEPSLFLAGRGFTGHEHLPWFNLINMNGRVYDPLTGVFLSPDNYLQNPGFTQNYNRYAYCFNNPLKFRDPSGNYAVDPELLIRMILNFIGPIHDASYFHPYLVGGDDGAIVRPNNSASDRGASYSDYAGTVSNLLSEVNSGQPAGGTSQNDNRGGIISIANVTAAYGVGPMLDFGVAFDGKGESSMYFTVGWVAGMGAFAGMGYSVTNKSFNVEDLAGKGVNGNLAIEIMGLVVGFETFGDWIYGKGWPGANMRGSGGNVGVGAGGFGGGNTYTFLFPVPSSDIWSKPWRHF